MIKCKRCKVNSILPGESYPKYFIMHWADIKIVIEGAVLCASCVDALFDKISKALYEDKP